MREMQAAFRIEAEELVTDLEETLLQLESNNEDSALIDRVFRSLHTLKGSGSSSGFLRLASFLHIFEDAFNLAREGKLLVTQELIDLSLKTVDRITECLADEPGAKVDETAIRRDPILVELQKILPGAKDGPAAIDQESVDDIITHSHQRYQIDFCPNEGFMAYGNDPISVLDELKELGPTHIVASSRVPTLDALDPEKTYLSWRIQLFTESGPDEVGEIFSFVEDDATIEIEHAHRSEDKQSRKQDLFDAEMLADFDLEAACLSELLSSQRASDGQPAAVDTWAQAGSLCHRLNGCCGLLLSSATELISKHHPIVTLSHLCESVEAKAQEEPEAALPEGLAECVLELILSFKLGYAPYQLPSHLLEVLDLDPDLFRQPEPEANAKEVDPARAAFDNILTQSLSMIEHSASVLDALNLDRELAIIERGFGNLERAAKSQSDRHLLALCESFAEGLREKVDAGVETLRSHLEPILAKIKEPPEEKPGAAAKTPEAASASRTEKSTLRVEEEKIDRLMRAVGELLVARGAFPMIAKNVADTHGLSSIAQELREAGANVARLADELQGAVMSIRMRSLQGPFQRFPRMVRDISKSLNKKINFIIEGEDTELDKSMVEQLGDPLVHIIRNALDHGIETLDERSATHKPETATIKLGAYTEGATVAIRISDDGRGLDPQKLRKKAIQKGLISQEEADAMPDAQAQQLIMRAGFSTAESVTDLSGRGVGMDVVANNIQKLQGTIEIESVLGSGTTFILRLPTSLLISEAILLRSGSEEYLIPTDSVASLEKLPAANIRSHGGTRMMTVRDEVINLVDLRELLCCPRGDDQLADTLNIALVHTREGSIGLIADRFLSQEDIVVKPLSGELSKIKIFSGVSIMGDGRIVPVINAMEIHSYYLHRAELAASAILDPA